MDDVKSPCFGISPGPYDQGATPCCAMNSNNLVVEVHKSQGNSGLWWWVGQVNGVSLGWAGHGTVNDDSGYNPSVALTDSNVVVEVHDSGHGTLWYWTGQVNGNSITWDRHGEYDKGVTPAVAANKNGVVVEIHRSQGNSGLWWWVGQLDGTSLHWNGHASLRGDSGYNPSVAVNGNGLVVEVHESGHGTLWYWIGQVSGNAITWTGHAEYDDGIQPSVMLTDDNMVYEVHQSQSGATLWQRIGRVNGTQIEWLDWYGNGSHSNYYDDGVAPRIAGNGRAAVQVHVSGNSSDLYGNASLIFNRARWMGDHLSTLSNTALRDLALPASHDAGMYTGGFSSLAKTQDLNLYGQLAFGVRYFDMRPKYENGDFVLYHGPINGPPLSEALADIQRFFNEGHRELAILKFSHFDRFSQDVFDKLCARLQDPATGLGNWLYDETAPLQPRLAERTLGTFLSQRGTVLVVCDGDFIIPSSPSPSGIFRYRDWESGDPASGDLTVFDIYSDTTSFDTMAYSTEIKDNNPPRGQLPKFLGALPTYPGFNGACLHDPNVPCDLFLLSWTLTPPTYVWGFSRLANKQLVDSMAATGLNAFGRPINLLYTDYVEYSRSTDVALIRNGCTP